jgi:SAM-dependent methyltransferase
MQKTTRWIEAQETERDFWDGMARYDHTILRVLADSSEKVPRLKGCLPRMPSVALEVGVGPFGIGVIGFLLEIPLRFALDPLSLVSVDSGGSLPALVQNRRAGIRYMVGRGEEIPVRSASMDLVICCNAIDHSFDPAIILHEIYRVLKPGGSLFLDVDTYSLLGLAKWHAWTKHARKKEILVKAHPHRLREGEIAQNLQSSGFHVQKLSGHNLVSAVVGHATVSTFWASK